MSESRTSPTLWPLAVVILFACAVNWPCLVWGLQYGHDHNLHVTYLEFFAAQLHAGEIYPRWITDLNFGAGSPIFFIQYPWPFYATAAVQWILHIPTTPVGDAHALGLFMFLTGVVSGITSWLWCRTLTHPIAAALASMIYLTMPYVYSCDVYYRASIGEYGALAWAPLMFFFAHWIETRPARAIAGMAVAFAAVILSNFFTAVLLTPFLVLYVICLVPHARVFRAALFAAAGLVLGLGLSSVYVLPMNAHRAHFVQANMIKLGLENFDYRAHLFPFGQTLFPGAHQSLRIVDGISMGLGLAVVALVFVRLRQSRIPKLLAYAAVVCVLATCAAPLLHSIGVVPHPELSSSSVIDVRSRIFLITFLTLEAALLAWASLRARTEFLPDFLLTASLACYFLETRWSGWLWQHAIFLSSIQFPWRLSGLLSIFATGLIAFALRDVWALSYRRKITLMLYAGLWLAVAAGSYFALDIPNNLTPPFLTEIKHRIETPYAAYANISRMPTPDELGPNDGLASGVLLQAGEGTARLDNVTPRHLRLEANCYRGCTVLLKLVYYPAWRAHEASGQAITLQSSQRAGLTELSLNPGSHEVDLELPLGSSEVWGARLSLISVGVLALLVLGKATMKA